MNRLRLTTSRPAGYRRGGQVIGNAASPTVLDAEELAASQVLTLARDPNVTIEVELEDREGQYVRMTVEDRAELIRELRSAVDPQLNSADPGKSDGEGDGAAASQSEPEVNAADQKAAGEEEKQPEATAEPPVAEPVKTPPKKAPAKKRASPPKAKPKDGGD